jgi:hypothetical protein
MKKAVFFFIFWQTWRYYEECSWSSDIVKLEFTYIEGCQKLKIQLWENCEKYSFSKGWILLKLFRPVIILLIVIWIQNIYRIECSSKYSSFLKPTHSVKGCSRNSVFLNYISLALHMTQKGSPSTLDCSCLCTWLLCLGICLSSWLSNWSSPLYMLKDFFISKVP